MAIFVTATLIALCSRTQVSGALMTDSAGVLKMEEASLYRDQLENRTPNRALDSAVLREKGEAIPPLSYF